MYQSRLNSHVIAALLATSAFIASATASAQAPSTTDPHVTSKGLPLAERESLSLESTITLFTDAGSVPAAFMFDLVAGFPVADRTLVDVRLPITNISDRNNGVTSVGNLMLGVHHVISLDPHMWLTVGGAIGMPLNPRDFNGATTTAGGALWNLHEVYPGIIPLYGRVAFEDHLDSIVFRAEAEPVLYAPYTDQVRGAPGKAQFSLQHAVEVQFGGAIGGGLRLQGFLFPTNDGPLGTGDVYQLGMEPFLFIEKSTLFARLGLMMPLDEELGPPAKRFVGFRFALGARFD